ncbi:hypothetical protein COB21_04200 [Candidatus Aerophobetes bacterium]|uniref:G domain-containing protein n=1 Tax=Aerophobetes bacterium TaxID=2030807 RepID=A0A2A4X295_UNCAE|nr:MAG: hypothetical protein COB21_04200 [Candidatus Aerophobetes bacterium]
MSVNAVYKKDLAALSPESLTPSPSPELNAIESFKALVTSLVNPFLIQDLVQALKSATTTKIDPEKGILPFFQALTLPEDVRQSLSQLDTHIRTCEKTQAIGKDFKLFCKQQSKAIRARVSEMNKYSNTFFHLSEIKQLGSVTMQKVDKLIATNTADTLEEFLLFKLAPFFKPGENIGAIISKKTEAINPDWDLYTLLAEIINSRAQQTLEVLTSQALPQNNTYLERLEAIRKKIETFKQELIQNHGALLTELIGSLISNQLESIDLSLLKGTLLHRRLKNIRKDHLSDLNVSISLQALLKKIVLEANYQRTVAEDQLLEVSSTMNLLRDATKHVQRVAGKKVSFFMGNTGSGKSTAVGFLLGANVVKRANSVGESVLCYKLKEGQDPALFPQIGQSLGESETLYTTGYLAPNGAGIADCPGFKDTRGSDFELCTNLSIDEAVNQVGSIQSVVAVVPAAHFLNDRGQSILELIQTIRDKFPFAFSDSDPSQNSRVFLLITKIHAIPPESLSKLQDGTRFDLLAKEAQTKISQLSQRIDEASVFQLRNLEQRRDTWNAIHAMQSQHQVDFIDVKVRTQRKHLLSKYTDASGAIDKALYSRAMDSGAMQQKFGKCVDMAINTWKDQIVLRFLDRIPSSIAQHTQKINDNKVSIQALREKIKQIAAELKSKQAPQKKDLMSELALTLKLQKNGQSKLVEKKQIAALQKANKSEQAQITKHRQELAQLAVVIKTQWKTLEQLKAFAEIVLRGTKHPQNNQHTLEVCESFLQVFDTRSAELLERCDAILKTSASSSGGSKP